MSESHGKVGGRLAPAFSRKLLAVALGAALGITLLAPAQSAPKQRVNQALRDRNAQVEIFVRLKQPSVAELNADAVQATGDLASDAAQVAQVSAIASEQANMRSVLASHGATLLSSLKVGANGLRVRVPASEVAGIRDLPGVRSVGRVVRYRPTNITSVPSIGAPEVWQKYKVKGKGVTVGIIDSGIDYTHANFGGPGTPAAYTSNDPNIIEPGSFPTAKVVGGYDFAGALYNADIEEASVPTPDPDPLDGNDPNDEAAGHGSHVAGTAAGIGVPGSIGPGVAPEAKLYALKVFGDHGGSTDLVSEAIEWALDPNHDGNMRDHLDVINMSLGSDYGDPNDPSAISAENAAKMGIIVVASSGNAGSTPYVTGSPAVAPSVISTAAVTPAGRIHTRVNVTAPASVAGLKNNLEGSGPVTVAEVGPITGTLVKVANAGSPAPDDGCTTPFTNASAVSGKIVLIVRGNCNFTVKVNNAAAAGARAVIVRNHGDPLNDGIDPIIMALEGTTIPAVMIGYADGLALAGVAATAATSPVNVTLDVGLDPSKDDQIATFSSRGPGHGSTFKPDISAPGISIVSTGVGTGTDAKNLQGTSMASPHVAGAAALLHQLHPRLKPDGIKALLQNSTVDANPSYETSLARQGVGSLRVSNAADLTSYASPGGISFGRLNPIFPDIETETVTLYNMDNRTRVFKVKHRPHQTYPGVSVSCPATVVVPRGGSQKFQVRLAFNPIASGKADAFDDARVSQTEVDGWCVLDDGQDELRVGYLAVVDAASNMKVLPGRGARSHRIFNIGPAPGIAEGFTFAKSGGARYGHDDEKPAHTFDEVGFRTAAPGQYQEPYQVVEFGISLKQAYEGLSDLSFEMDLDTNGDGKTDVILLAADYKLLSGSPNADLGQYATAQIDLASGDNFIDWFTVGWDFNDRVLILPFTKNTGPLTGFVPTGKFAYTLTVTSGDGSVDTQTGTIDFSKELTPDLNDFVLDPLGSAEVSVSGKGPGRLMWLLPNDQVKSQSVSLEIVPPRK